MSVILERIQELADPAAAAAEVASLNERLAAERSVPADVAQQVHEIADALGRTAAERWEAIDPQHAVVLLRAVVSAQVAADAPGSAAARDELRVALETTRQALAAIAEREPVADERTTKEIVRWLVDTTGVPQARLARLLGVSPRQFQRWISPADRAQPEGDDGRAVRAVARIVAQLRFVLTPAGVIDWFSWPRDDLGGRAPGELLSDPARLPDLTAAAGRMRSMYAT